LKKITAILFLSIYLLSVTEAHQLLKLPVIFQHFAEHQQENSKITFLEFLDMHYMHGSPKDKDYDRDMQLPFKTANDCISVISPAFVPSFIAHSIEVPVVVIHKKIFIQKDQLLISSYLANIWQPPKSC